MTAKDLDIQMALLKGPRKNAKERARRRRQLLRKKKKQEDSLKKNPQLQPSSSSSSSSSSLCDEDASKQDKDLCVYVGSAYGKASTDMARKPSEWKTTAESVGYWCHPNGWQYLRDHALLPTFLSRFSQKRCMIECDIGWYDINNTALGFIHDDLKKYGFACDGVATCVNTTRCVQDPDLAAHHLKLLHKPMMERGLKTFLLIQVVCPESVQPANAAVLRNGVKNREKLWLYIARKSGCDGVVLDHPALHWCDVPQHNDIALDVARSTLASKDMQFYWMLNGGTSVAHTTKFLKDLENNNVIPDKIIVSHFHNTNYSGTPDTGSESVTAQAKCALRFYEG
jgi:hypothetical protein